MALADPQSVTINAVAQTLPRTATGVNTSTYTKEDGNVILSVQHSYARRTRRSVRLQSKKIAPDPFQSGVNNPVSGSITFVVDMPNGGFYTNAEIKQLADALVGYLSASSGAKITSVLGGES